MSDRDDMGDDNQPELFDVESPGLDDSPFDIESAAIEDAVAATDEAASPSPDDAPDDDDGWADFTAEDYMQTATQEYADLAAAMEAAESEERPEQAALVADMPGMESNLVGLEDVVAAEGMEAAEAAQGSDLALRVGTGLALVALFFGSLFYQWAIGALIVIVMVVAAGEMATVLRRQGYHPVALFAYLGTLGLLLGTWAYGPVAIPFGAAVALLVVLLFFGLVAGRDDPLTGMTLTMLAILWVGVPASFAMDLVSSSEFRWLIGSLVVIVAVMDIAQYFVGKRLGKRPLAPVVSPKKTVAGLVGGVVAAVGTGYGLSFLAPFDTTTGVVLGAALAATGPIGDLAVSVLKRTLGIKDMGTILPGHGGVLDRIDAILYSLPAAWLVYAWASLLV